MYVFKRDVDLIELNSFFYSNASIELYHLLLNALNFWVHELIYIKKIIWLETFLHLLDNRDLGLKFKISNK
jgi:hypothetical protein